MTIMPAAAADAEEEDAAIGPPGTDADDGGEEEAEGGEEDPVGAHPEDEAGVAAVPGAALELGEEGPGVAVVLVGHEDADAAEPVGPLVGVVDHVFLPDHREEEGARGAHDGDVGQDPLAVVALEALDHAEEERVLGHGAHDVVGDSRRDGAADPGAVGEEGVETSLAPVVEVEIDAAVVGEDEVADGVGALDRVRVGDEGFEEPGIFFLDEGVALLIRPQNVFVVWVEVYAGLLGGEPVCGDGLVDVGLMDDFGDDLGSSIEKRGVGSWEFGAVDCVGRGIFDEEGEEGKDAVDGEDDEREGDEEKDQQAAAHRGDVFVEEATWGDGK